MIANDFRQSYDFRQPLKLSGIDQADVSQSERCQKVTHKYLKHSLIFYYIRQLWIINYYVKNNFSNQNKHSNQVNSTLGQINVTYLLSQLRWKVIWKTSKLLKNVIAIHSRPFIHISEKRRLTVLGDTEFFKLRWPQFLTDLEKAD